MRHKQSKTKNPLQLLPLNNALLKENLWIGLFGIESNKMLLSIMVIFYELLHFQKLLYIFPMAILLICMKIPWFKYFIMTKGQKFLCLAPAVILPLLQKTVKMDYPLFRTKVLVLILILVLY